MYYPALTSESILLPGLESQPTEKQPSNKARRFRYHGLAASALGLVAALRLVHIFLLQTSILPSTPAWDDWISPDPLTPSLKALTDSNGTMPFRHRTVFRDAATEARYAPLGVPRAQVKPPQLELVISYYDEDLSGVVNMINTVYRELPHWEKKTIVYHKGVGKKDKDKKVIPMSEKEEDDILRAWIRKPELLGLVDEVIGLENIGRDGGTHLRHM